MINTVDFKALRKELRKSKEGLNEAAYKDWVVTNIGLVGDLADAAIRGGKKESAKKYKLIRKQFVQERDRLNKYLNRCGVE